MCRQRPELSRVPLDETELAEAGRCRPPPACVPDPSAEPRCGPPLPSHSESESESARNGGGPESE
eukprot:3946662-Lingulodinium_polyedra.AAC.1